MRDRFEERYVSGDIPWDHGMPDFNLIEIVGSVPILPCRVLDVGCGTGDNSIWLAGNGFDVTGCDISPTAIRMAEQKAKDARVSCRFLVVDFLNVGIQEPFGFVFDRGCLHTFDLQEERREFAQNVAACLKKDGFWLTLVGNADTPPRDVGPPRLSASELISVVEPSFEVVSLRSGFFGGDQNDPPKAWVCLLRKRSSSDQIRCRAEN